MRIQIDLPKEVIKLLEQLAKAENRSRKNFIETLIIEETKRAGKNPRPESYNMKTL